MASAAPAVVSPPPGNPRFPLFDGLRAIAVLAVLVTHVSFIVGLNRKGGYAAVFSNLDAGVTIFFVISGFLLYRPFIAADFAGRTMATARYARRRFLRIVPLYWLVLTILAVFPPHVINGVLTENWWHFYFLVQTYSTSPDVRLGGMVQTWSLDIEVAFYVALPLYALVARKFLGGSDPAKRMKRDLIALAAIAAGSVALRSGLYESGNAVYLYNLGSYAGWFAVGMALAVVSASASAVPRAAAVGAFFGRRTVLAAAIAILIYLVLGVFTPADASGYRLQTLPVDLLYFIATALMAGLLVSVAVFAPDGERRRLPARVLSNRALAWVGMISYGVFLWHMALMFMILGRVWPFVGDQPVGVRLVVVVLLTAALSVPIAAVTYYLVERPILRFKEPRRATDGQPQPTASG
ncbi:MAG: acyltransferase family protein [Actinobacteria bacterium]|uniref:Unannotated protein n=1 Tax=freshwater metagenome TaxID=449393 RepID=A0A6J6A1Z1_9ZZZZ|nr:acyltransferase family protein [Actinomycetota bacterium]